MIDRFIKENKNCLSGAEVAILEGWKESFEGIFEVKSVDEVTVRLYNLIDEAEYIATSNVGKQGLKRFSTGEFVITRLVPLDDIYLLSGVSFRYPSEARSMLEEEALKIVKSNLPASLGKNKEKWAQGWQMQKKLRNEFISYFKDEIIVVAGEKLQETMEGFLTYYTEKTKSKLSESEKAKYAGLKSTLSVPEKLATADSASVIFDETEGLKTYTDFKLFMETFKNPNLIKDEEYKEVIMGYLWSDTISPLPFRKMVERYPENARKVFATLFNKRNWSNEKDFPALMRKYKGAFLKEKPKPTVIPAVQKIRYEKSKR
ncbi:hypothetical protein HX99_06135 [Peptococcaceae bacterium SCADC1_2_3]|nr:hypothetical protein DK28_0214695 [Peptococcaceae bacterium SCADC1_2_3]KFI35353.1 hypothetical protein HX99_06135 [Peptococcaceae bacterium SCADC1_2_3]